MKTRNSQQLPDYWKLPELGDVATLSGRIGWKGLTAKEYTESGPLFLSVHSLNHGDYVDFRDAFHISQHRYDESPEIKLQPGDVLICKDGAGIGKVGIVADLPGAATINSSLLLIRASELVVSKYLYFALLSPYFQRIVQSRLEGATTPHLYQREIKGFPLRLPPLPEQKRIVAILDEAFARIATAVANTEKNLANARELFDSYLNAVFTQKGEGWVEAPIGQHIRFIDYRGKTPKKTESGLRLITAKNVKMGYLQEVPIEFVAPETYDNWMTRGIPRLGDVLFTTEAPLANVAQLDTDEKVVFAQRIIIMQPDASMLDCTFLKYLLMSRPVQHRIHAKGTGATVKGIKASLLRRVEIAFPTSLHEQQQIVTKLDALASETHRLQTLYQHKLTNLAELKQSLLHKAFSGELTAQPERALQEAVA